MKAPKTVHLIGTHHKKIVIIHMVIDVIIKIMVIFHNIYVYQTIKLYNNLNSHTMFVICNYISIKLETKNTKIFTKILNISASLGPKGKEIASQIIIHSAGNLFNNNVVLQICDKPTL